MRLGQVRKGATDRYIQLTTPAQLGKGQAVSILISPYSERERLRADPLKLLNSKLAHETYAVRQKSLSSNFNEATIGSLN